VVNAIFDAIALSPLLEFLTGFIVGGALMALIWLLVGSR
jgi:hypothetical protein